MIKSDFDKRFIAARRSAISSMFGNLNDMQLNAVLATEGPLLVLAGAGSGKTTVLINRVANIIEFGRGSDCNEVPPEATEDDITFLNEYALNPAGGDSFRMRELCAVDPCEPWRVIAITFTNKAANELKSRLEYMLGPSSGDVWAMTFHSACVRILRRNIERLGYSPDFAIYDTSDSISVITRILKEMNLDEKVYSPKTILNYISRAKDSLITPEEFSASAQAGGDIRRRNIAAVYIQYAARLKSANAVDFDDIILLTVRLLTDFEDVRDYYQRKFRYVLIDEYQDTNNLQYLLASKLAEKYKNICVVGDDDQSIYKFRGATIENILNFEKQYKSARTIRLEQNYRSTGNILNAANAVIKNNTGRKGKNLWTQKGSGEKITLHCARNEYDEAQYVSDKIVAAVALGGNWRDNAVLYRMNAQSNQFERAFQRSGIPYRIVGGTRFYDRAEIKDIVAYLSVINNPYDDLRLLRIINNPSRGIGRTTLERLGIISQNMRLPLYEVIRRCRDYPELQAAAGKLHIFFNLIEDMRQLEQTVSLEELYDYMLDKSGYMNMLTSKPGDENQNRIENIKELKSNIITYEKENTNSSSLAGFLDEISLYTDLEQYNERVDSVVMMTIHSAKGLEFPTVFIVGAEDGIFPSSRVIGDHEEMEEERRLCYVAITRAKKRLYFTCAHQRMLFGHTSSNRTSRFVSEIPDEYIEKTDSQPYSPDVGFDHGYGAGFGNPYGDSGYSRRNSGYSVGYGGSSRQEKNAFTSKSRSKPSSADISAYKTGDTVEHTAFGRGIIVSLTPMGGDALIEVNFETCGRKRLMLKSAAQHMKKL